jgi:hypothetical protein
MKIFNAFFILIVLQACNPPKLLVVSKNKENLYKPTREDTIVLKSLSVIDRFRYDRSFFKKSPYFLVKDKKPTSGKLEDAFYEITDSGRYEYSFPFVLQTIKNALVTKEFPVLFDKNFSFKNDSLFKPLLNDSLFKIRFDTNYTKKLTFNFEDGVHMIVNVLRFFYPDISESGHIVWLTIYFEVFEIKGNEVKKYTCILRDRNGKYNHRFMNTLKKHNWRIEDKDTKRVFEKLFKLGLSKEVK